MGKKLNVVFLHVDQLKQSAIGAYGCEHVNTPHMDRIFAESVAFDRSYAAVPVCVPTRTAWYTGLDPELSGVTNNGKPIHDPDNVMDLGRWLRDRGGYDCYYMGKWHIALPWRQCGFVQLHGSNAIGEYGDTSVARAAEEFLLTRDDKKPFFLNIGLLNPHDICYWAFKYTPGKFAIASRMADRLPPLPPNFRKSPTLPDWSRLDWQFYTEMYFRLVEMVDEEIGRIYRAYLSSPQRDNTVFIFSSDHGQGNGEHSFPTKNAPYEHSIRVPLAIVDPAVSPRRDPDHLVSGLDMAPTICDYAGLERMPRNSGRSMRAVVRDRATPWRDWLQVSSMSLRLQIILKGDWKLIYDRLHRRVELFDLAKDPWEMHNLSENPGYSDRLKELLAVREEYNTDRERCPAVQQQLARWK